MKHSTGSQNCGQISNISTKRSGNMSRQSTCRGKTTFSNQSSCFSSPKNVSSSGKMGMMRNGSSYSQIHLKERNSVTEERYEYEEREGDAVVVTEEVITSSIKIQRFWRFHMLMRRRANTKLISKLTQDTTLHLLTLHNLKTQNSLLLSQLSSLHNITSARCSSQLASIKQLMKQFTQSTIKKQINMMNVVGRARKEIGYYSGMEGKLREEIEEQERGVIGLLDRQKYLRDRQQGHVGRANRLNKDLILVNMEKSRMQLQVDQMRCQLREGVE